MTFRADAIDRDERHLHGTDDDNELKRSVTARLTPYTMQLAHALGYNFEVPVELAPAPMSGVFQYVSSSSSSS